MAGAKIELRGMRSFRAAVRAMNPRRNPRVFGDTIKEVLVFTERFAKTKEILGGGGGKASGFRKAHPSKLTSRTGIGRRSITTDFSQLPRQGSIGSDRDYMAIHQAIGKRPWLSNSIDAAIRAAPSIAVRVLERQVARATRGVQR